MNCEQSIKEQAEKQARRLQNGSHHGQQISAGEPLAKKSQRQILKEQIAAEEAAERDHSAKQLSLQQVYSGIRGGFVGQIATLQDAIYSWNQHQGFWNHGQSETGTKIALMHSELSEALEADRKQITTDDHIPEFSGVEAELADAVIRILDFAGAHHLRLADAIIAKLQFNLTRPYRHGKSY